MTSQNEALTDRVQEQIDNNWPVEAEDIQELLDMNEKKDAFIEAVLLQDYKLMIERFQEIEQYYTTTL